MSASAAQGAFGVTLTRLTAAGPPKVYTNLVELVSVTPPERTQETIDATHHGSPDKYREYIPGLKDGGEVPFNYNWTKDGQTALITAMDAGKGEYKVLAPDGSAEVFQAIITSVAYDPMEIDGKMVGSGSMKVSGKPVYTAAA